MLNHIKKKLSLWLDHEWAIGLSGGCDSIVLYDLLKKAYPEKTVHVIHVDHGVNPDSHQWAQFCQKIASDHFDPIEVHAVRCQKKSEEHFREKRYEAFALSFSRLPKPSVLFLAHHAADQKETVLWRFLRGSPLPGLAGIQEVQVFIKNAVKMTVVRPLLDIEKIQIEQYATTNQLQYVHDPSNFNTQYTRNAIRHQLLAQYPDHRILFSHERILNMLTLVRELVPQYFQDPLSFPLQQCTHLSHQSVLTLVNDWLSQYDRIQPHWKSLSDFVMRCSHHQSPTLPLGPDSFLYGYKGDIFLESADYQGVVPQPLLTTNCEGVWGAFYWKKTSSKKILIRRLKSGELKKIRPDFQGQEVCARRRPYTPAFFDPDHQRLIAYGTLIADPNQDLLCYERHSSGHQHR